MWRQDQLPVDILQRHMVDSSFARILGTVFYKPCYLRIPRAEPILGPVLAPLTIWSGRMC